MVYSVYRIQNTMTATLTRLDSSPDLVEQVHQRLLDAICAGQLAPGTRLTQEELAEQLSVSRQPVIQALRLLKADGLVQDAPGLHGTKGRGVLVAPLDAGLIGHIYQVRSALDALAARLAAERRAVLDPALLAQGRQAVAQADVAAMLKADQAFHRAIYAASGNPLIEGSAMLHWTHIRRAMGLVLQHSSLRASVWDEHAAMADAIARGDVYAVTQLAVQHCEQAGQHLCEQMSHVQAQPAIPQVNSVVP